MREVYFDNHLFEKDDDEYYDEKRGEEE